MKRKTFVTLCTGLISFVIFLIFANQFTGEQADFADPAGLSEQQWLGKIDDLRVNRRALARAIGTCERGLDTRLNDGRISQADLKQLALELDVRPMQAARIFCGRFLDAVIDQNMPLKDYTWAIAAQPTDVLQALAKR